MRQSIAFRISVGKKRLRHTSGFDLSVEKKSRFVDVTRSRTDLPRDGSYCTFPRSAPSFLSPA